MTLSQSNPTRQSNLSSRNTDPSAQAARDDRTLRLNSSNPYVFVLWGDRFDAEIAVIFVSQLRRVGLNVKIVGINGMAVTGQHRIVLRPDMLLGEVMDLADETICVVLPCDVVALKRLHEDPRVISFISEAFHHSAYCVALSAAALAETGFSESAGAQVRPYYYRSRDKALDCACELGMVLKETMTRA